MNDVIYTAMCMWEHVLAVMYDNPAMRNTFDGKGTCEVRDQICNFAERCNADWKAVSTLGYDSSFDWDFVPKWMDDHLVWTEDGVECLKPVQFMYLGAEAEA